MGFDIGGVIYYVHEFNHANLIAYPYIQTATLPVRARVTGTDGGSAVMDFICCAVVSEGGQDGEAGSVFCQEVALTAGSGARTYALSLQPKTTFGGFPNRTRFEIESVSVLVTGANPVLAEVCIGQALSGSPSWTDVNATYSGMQYDTAGTLSGAPAIVADLLYTAATNQNRGSQSRDLGLLYPITLDAAGSARDLGRLTVLVTGVGGASACRVAVRWREVR